MRRRVLETSTSCRTTDAFRLNKTSRMSLYGDSTKWPSPFGACPSLRLWTTRRGGEGKRERVARQHHQQNKQADRLFGCAAHQLGYIHDRCSFNLDPAAPGGDRASLTLEL